MDRDNILQNLQIAKTCPAAWSEMTGDEKSRWCGNCKLNVYNLSAMSDEEVESLVHKSGSEGVCVKLFKRVDGKVMTSDCPLGIRIISKPISMVIAVGTVLAGFFTLVVAIVFLGIGIENARRTLSQSISAAFSSVSAGQMGQLEVHTSTQSSKK